MRRSITARSTGAPLNLRIERRFMIASKTSMVSPSAVLPMRRWYPMGSPRHTPGCPGASRVDQIADAADCTRRLASLTHVPPAGLPPNSTASINARMNSTPRPLGATCLLYTSDAADDLLRVDLG